MLNYLSILTKNYGFIKGLKTYCSLKFNSTGKIVLPNLKFPIFFRPKTIDKYTIIEIFGLNCYNLNLPFTPNFIIDGGANIGLSAVYFSNTFPESKIIAVEPELNNYNLLLKNIAPYNNITPLNNAIWKNNALLEIKDKGYGLRGYIVEEVKESSSISFKAISINDLNPENRIIDILKLDIEGSEKFVFEEDYENWLPKVRCLVIELHDDMIENCSKTVLETIAKYNFTQSQIEENLIFINKDLV